MEYIHFCQAFFQGLSFITADRVHAGNLNKVIVTRSHLWTTVVFTLTRAVRYDDIWVLKAQQGRMHHEVPASPTVHPYFR